ncbi:hypothetical protein SPBR_06831 [Sporothrix brasiliensis 5110]|uniref:C6 zinc finger domain containing protein n=1 Tax=Sporothrix brasiliensis 5110 TaxID=1398154 RepID=A0A0C2IJ85_9PEZI|nr:uncharacterized protein SPBR_06831 [Sporothrix brasiliensis 5110]KIH89206.1 hypothetical protein SPBR_06831 [Sporothrix brasiliensis 5110]
MLRRRHKKSRAGCLECKRRHVKASADTSLNASQGTSPPPGASAASSAPTSVVTPALPVFPSQSTGSPNASGDGGDPLLLIDDADGAINVSHAELIVHLMTDEDIQSLAANPNNLSSGMVLGLRAGIRTPYLLYAMLAFSARHLAYLANNSSDIKHTTPPQSQSWHTQEQWTPEQASQPSVPSSVPWIPSQPLVSTNPSSLSMPSSSSPSSMSSPSLSTAASPVPPPSQYSLPSSLPPLSFSSTPPYVTQSPTAAARYKRQSVLLQTRAISLFNTAWRASHGVFDRSNCVPMLLFSSILGHHLFADSLASRHDSLDKFLEDYVQCAQLQQGVSAIAMTTWPLLLQSEFAPILQWSARFTSRKGRGHDCAQLLTLVNRAPEDRLSASAKNACHLAIRLLQVGFDVLYLPAPKSPKTSSTHSTSQNGSTDADTMDMDDTAERPVGEGAENADSHDNDGDEEEKSDEDKNEHLYRHKMILLWALIMPKEFSDLLAAKNPESLVILAYYACLLNHGRHLWQVGDAGEYIMGLISDYMDPVWDEWLEEPRRRLATDVVQGPTP